MMAMNSQTALWVLFALVMTISLSIDLGLKSHRERTTAVSIREATAWLCVWISLALGFAGVIWWVLGQTLALEFITGYLIEESLSVDNMFVIVLIFKFFAIAPAHQARVLKYGILGAIVMRFFFIFAGVALLNRFHWIFYLFGAFLVFTGIKMFFQGEEAPHPDQNILLRVLRRIMPVTNEFHGQKFLVRQDGRWAATPLFAALLVVEATDLLFATDSIPAVLAVSRHPFIVFTSNIFAVLGLRALYFLISGVMDLFHYLRYGLAIILLFIGAKMLIADIYKISAGLSLLVVGFCLMVSIAASLYRKRPAL